MDGLCRSCGLKDGSEFNCYVCLEHGKYSLCFGCGSKTPQNTFARYSNPTTAESRVVCSWCWLKTSIDCYNLPQLELMQFPNYKTKPV